MFCVYMHCSFFVWIDLNSMNSLRNNESKKVLKKNEQKSQLIFAMCDPSVLGEQIMCYNNYALSTYIW